MTPQPHETGARRVVVIGAGLAGLTAAATAAGLDDPADDPRSRLEALLDRAQPGWRDEVVEVRSGRRLVVAHGRPLPGSGLAGRPSVAVIASGRAAGAAAAAPCSTAASAIAGVTGLRASA